MIDITMLIVRANIRKPWAKQLQDLWFKDLVLLEVIPDIHFNMDDLKGDTYNHKVNHDIPIAQLLTEERNFELKVERQGVYGLIGKARNNQGEWDHVDSCFGFVGTDYLNSGYDEDIAQSTIKKVTL